MDTETRKQLYIGIYKSVKHRSGQPAVLAIVLAVMFTFFAGISTAGVLVIGKVYAFLPDEGLVTLTRIIGIISVVIYAILMFIANTFYVNHTKPLYANPNDMNLDTQLLEKNNDGIIGYYSEQGAWVELKSVEILREDEKLIKVWCQFYNTAINLNFPLKNFIAKEDDIYSDIKTIATVRKAKKRNYTLIYLAVLIAFVAMFIFNIRLLGIRDTNRIQFGSAEITSMM